MNLKSIKTRLLVYYSIAIIVLLSLFSAILLYIFYMQNIKTIETQLLVIAQNVDYEIVEHHKNNFQKEFDEEHEFSISNLVIKVIDKKSTPKIVASNNQQLEVESTKKLRNGTFTTYTIRKNGIELLGISYKSLFLDEFYLELETTIDDKIDEAYDKLINILLILIPIGMIIFMFIGYLMIKNSFKSVKKVINEVHQIEIQNLSNRIETLQSNDEIGELIDTFNSLLDRVDEGVAKIKRFSNDVSHELKTPLTVIRGEIELSLRKNRTTEEYKEVLSTLLSETKSLQELIDSLLFLSTKNIQELQNKFEAVPVESILLDVIEDLSTDANEKQIKFDILKLDSIEVQANEILLKTMISNLIQNSVKYSNSGGKIEITLSCHKLTIKDYGIGIDKEDLKHIFERFYRADVARVRDGFGLGLSIVALISSIHNFKIDIQSEYGEFTEVSIDFET